MITEPTLVRIGEAVQLNHRGEREAARLLFAEIWDEIGGEQGDPLHVCTLAHGCASLVRGCSSAAVTGIFWNGDANPRGVWPAFHAVVSGHH